MPLTVDWITLKGPEASNAAAQQQLEVAFNEGRAQGSMDWHRITEALNAGADPNSTLSIEGGNPSAHTVRVLAQWPHPPTLLDYWLGLAHSHLTSEVVNTLAKVGTRGTPTNVQQLMDHGARPWPLLQAWVSQGVLAHQAPTSSLSLGERLFVHADEPEALALWQQVAQRPEGRDWLMQGTPLQMQLHRDRVHRPKLPKATLKAWVNAYHALDPTWAHLGARTLEFHADQRRTGDAMVQALLQAGAPLVDSHRQSHTLVHVLAGRASNTHAVTEGLWQTLWRHGGQALINQPSAHGEMPLHWWAHPDCRGPRVLSILLRAGAQVHARDAHGDTALDRIIAQPRLNEWPASSFLAIVQQFTEAGFDWEAPHPIRGTTPFEALMDYASPAGDWVHRNVMAQRLARDLEQTIVATQEADEQRPDSGGRRPRL